MSNLINDWVPETKSLLEALIAAGFVILHGDNGEDEFQLSGNLEHFIDNLTACDEARLFVKRPGAKTKWLYLVFGNNPGELVSDYLVDDVLDKVCEDHYAKWELRGQPMKHPR